MSVELFVEKLLKCSPFGVKFTMVTKLTKHLKPLNVRKLRTYLMCLKLAFPDKLVSEMVDPKLVDEVRNAISPYYRPNINWKPGMDKWRIFIKLQEPPE